MTIMNQNHKRHERFYLLDILRGIAALSVVFWHWQHFFFSGTNPGAFDITRLPMSKWVFVLYTQGAMAIPLFFSLSGFVFYWLYSKRISENAITLSRFALLRFSRLYPLHFVTLVIVALSQIWLMNSKGSYFVYPDNNIKQFLLNLFFISSWGFDSIGYSRSFNGPIWSVSVEVLLYGLFFICCRLFPIRAIVLAIISTIGFLVVQKYYSLMVGRGIGSFFLGGCIFLAYQVIVASRHANSITRVVTYLMVSAWVATLVVYLDGVDITPLFAKSIPFLWRFDAYFQWGIQELKMWWTPVMLFPLTILSLALNETRGGTLGKRFSFIGDISYSSYLIHFPLQLLFSVVVVQLGISSSVYYSPWFMVLFFAVLITVSFVSFRYFEGPAQRSIRETSVQRYFQHRMKNNR